MHANCICVYYACIVMVMVIMHVVIIASCVIMHDVDMLMSLCIYILLIWIDYVNEIASSKTHMHYFDYVYIWFI